MTTFVEYILPPNVNGSSSAQGYLEIEVSRINLINEEARTAGKAFGSDTYYSNQSTPTTPCGSQGATAKFIWWGESQETAASIRISRPKASGKGCSNQFRNKLQKRSKRHQQTSPLRCHNKLRYSVRTSLALFLDYLHSCAPIEIVVANSNSNSPLGRAYLRLPSVLLRKFVSNYASGCTFEHNTKIYALYSKRTCSQPQPQQKQHKKTGEIQLRFRMLFAPSAKHAPPVLTSLHGLKDVAASSSSALHHHHHRQESRADTRKRSKSDEIVEAMMKLDAKLVAYLAGETLSAKEEDELTLEQLESPTSSEMVEELSREQQLDTFKSIAAIQLQMEALTLQPEGTKRMELLQSEVRPIFTVECQLSHELIKNVPRYDMFHIMQFESEKFQSLTQCTRFGQEAQRNVDLSFLEDNDDVAQKRNFGRIYFAVWWREPGTCLNEMLGMGVLELEELYNASLLEQCKRIAIQRRGVHLASLYFKISLQLERYMSPEDVKQLPAVAAAALCDDVSSVQVCNGGGNNGNAENCAEAKQEESASTSAGAGASANDNDGARAAAQPEANAASFENNNMKVETSNFTAETTKVRLLKGFVHVGQMRGFELNLQFDYKLMCRRFWHDECGMSEAEGDTFNYQEQFAVINDDQFLERCYRQELFMEIHMRSKTTNEYKAEAFAIFKLPLHQFYIAYKDEAMTNHLCKGRLPVISVDSWVNLMDPFAGLCDKPLGSVKCLLAIGSEEQINNLKDERGFVTTNNSEDAANSLISFFSRLDLLGKKLVSAKNCNEVNAAATSNYEADEIANKLKSMLQTVTVSPNSKVAPEAMTADSDSAVSSPGSSTSKHSVEPSTSQMAQQARAPSPAVSQLLNEISAQKSTKLPLKPKQSKTLTVMLDIQRAAGLPLNPAAKPCKKKKAGKRTTKAASSNARFPPNEEPSTYVTFQADECRARAYEAHEGEVFATTIVEKSVNPLWNQFFRVSISMDYVMVPDKFFILKVWRKANSDIAQCRLAPNPKDDAIIGFAALELSALLTEGLCDGWIDILDYNGRAKGKLEVRCHPLEDVYRICSPIPFLEPIKSFSPEQNMIEQFERSLDLTRLNIGQSVKRKFTELEAISQRLRTRLSDVTGEEISPQFDISKLDDYQFGSYHKDITDEYDDDMAEFEHDINTVVDEVTTDVDMVAVAAANTDSASNNNHAEMCEKMISAESVAADNPE